MKKYLLISAALVLTCASCAGGKRVDLETFNKEVNSIVEDFNAKYGALRENVELSQEEVAAKADSLYDATVGLLKDYCFDVIRHNKNDEVAVEALKAIYSDLGVEDVQKAINMLGKKNRENETVKKMQAQVASTLATAEGRKFTDFEVDGVKFSDFVGKGKYVLVDFWASWCGPCKREIPNIRKVYEKYAGPDFDVLSVAVWDKLEDTKAAAKAEGIVWSQMLNTQKVATDLYGIQGIPQIMLFSPDGTILKRDLRGEGIEAAVKEALGR